MFETYQQSSHQRSDMQLEITKYFKLLGRQSPTLKHVGHHLHKNVNERYPKKRFFQKKGFQESMGKSVAGRQIISLFLRLTGGRMGSGP